MKLLTLPIRSCRLIPMKVKVIQQSHNGEPSEMTWAGGAEPADDVTVMLSVAQLLRHAKDDAPWSPQVLEIRIEL